LLAGRSERFELGLAQVESTDGFVVVSNVNYYEMPFEVQAMEPSSTSLILRTVEQAFPIINVARPASSTTRGRQGDEYPIRRAQRFQRLRQQLTSPSRQTQRFDGSCKPAGKTKRE